MGSSYTSKVRVRIDETDLAGVVHFSKYFIYFGIAHWDLLKSLGISYTSFENSNVRPTIVVAHCEYKSPARYDEVLLVRAEVSEVRNKSIKYSYEIKREQDDTLIATGYAIHAFVNVNTRKAVEVPDWVREKLIGGG